MPSIASLQADDLKRLHENAIKHDPVISRAMGPNPKCERMRAGSLRVGGQGERKPALLFGMSLFPAA